MIEAAAIVWITLHTVRGNEVTINRDHIVTLADPVLLTEGAKCAISMVDGKFISVKQTCAEIRQLMDKRP